MGISRIKGAGQQLLPAALKALGDYSQFVIWRYEPQRIVSDGRTFPAGKLRKAGYSDSDIEKLMINETVKVVKAPINPATLNYGNPHDAINWLTASDAFARVAVLNQANGTQPYGVGFVLTASDPLFCLDVDSAATGDGWSVLANELWTSLPGCAVEVSHTGNGLHLWGTYRGPEPDHRCKNTALNIELYTSERFIALGRADVIGSAAQDCTEGLHKVIGMYFAPNEGNGAGGDWSEAWESLSADPVDPLWDGPVDNDELIAKALKSRSANQTFGYKATFSELWNADAEKLAGHWSGNTDGYDASSADSALAVHLAFWTGKDALRIERLMRQSKLVRAKWDEREDYLPRTIVSAVSVCTSVYDQNYKPTSGAETAAQTQPGVIPDGSKLGEGDIADLIQAAYSDRHCRTVKTRQWYARTPGKLWRLDRDTVTLREVIRQHLRATTMRRGSAIFGVVKHLESGLQDHGEWDNDPNLCGLPDDSVLDVSNGALRAAENNDRITRRLAVMPEAGEPTTWLRVLRETHVNKPDADAVIRYLQVFAGYALTGHTNIQKFLFLVGPPGGGKSTFIKTLAGIWGTKPGEGYATSIPSDALLDGRSQHAQWLTLFDGPRLAFVGESNNDSSDSKGRSWRVGDLKTLTAFDPISANKMRQDSYTFQPTAKLIIGANNVPNMRRFDEALRRRLVLIRCDNPVPNSQQDINLAEKLRAEAGQILTWALEGATEYCRNGLPKMPGSLRSDRDEYLETQDTFGEFLDARFIKAPGQFIAAETLRLNHMQWLHENPDDAPWSDRLRKQEMANRGYSAKLSRTNERVARGFLGLKEK